MNIFQFLFYLGIINIVFSFLWKWVFVLPTAFLFSVLKFDFGMRFVKIFGVYLMVSLVTLLTLSALGETPSVLSIIFYPLLGAFVIFMSLAINQYEARKQAYQSYDYELMAHIKKESNFEAIVLIGSVLFYIFVLFVPVISANALIVFLFTAIQWVYNIPVIGWIIGIGGVFFLINTIFHGLFAFGVITTGLLGMLKKNKTVEVIINPDEPKLE